MFVVTNIAMENVMTQPKTASKFTPGPWHLCSRAVWGSGKHVAQATRSPFPPYPYGEEAVANARLIAASPEMYELLRQVEAIDRFMRTHASRGELEEAFLCIREEALRLKEGIDGS